jgi:hypothetical protein
VAGIDVLRPPSGGFLVLSNYRSALFASDYPIFIAMSLRNDKPAASLVGAYKSEFWINYTSNTGLNFEGKFKVTSYDSVADVITGVFSGAGIHQHFGARLSGAFNVSLDEHFGDEIGGLG